MMTDDFYDPSKPDKDCHSMDCLETSYHEVVEFIVDPGSGQLSASRACFIWLNFIGSLLAGLMVAAGVFWGVSGAFIPAATIVTGLVASDASVYFASTRKGYRCNCEGEK